MKALIWLKRLLGVFALIFIFINWKIALIFFILGVIVHAIPVGPTYLLNVIIGTLIISGVVYFLINWKIAIILILLGIAVARFNLWAAKVNYNYYNKK